MEEDVEQDQLPEEVAEVLGELDAYLAENGFILCFLGEDGVYRLAKMDLEAVYRDMKALVLVGE